MADWWTRALATVSVLGIGLKLAKAMIAPRGENIAFRRVWDSYTREDDPMRKWIARLLGNPPVNPIRRIKTVDGC